MENLAKFMSESLLDNLDTMMGQADKSDKDMIFTELINKYPINKPGYDAYGRKLEVGDWVVYIDTGVGKSQLRQDLGKVLKIAPKRITIGDGFGTVSVNPNNVFKIMDKSEFIESLG